MSTELKYNFQEFACFLLIHASYADLEFSEEEKNLIKERMGEDVFNRIFEDYQVMGDYQVLQTIMAYKGLYYPTVQRKNELLDMMKTLFKADGEFSPLEKNLHHFLEKLL